MTTTVFIMDYFAEAYARPLRQALPELTVIAEPPSPDPQVDLSTIDVLMTFGNLIDLDADRDRLVRRATRLKWIHSLATGADHFLRLPALRSEVLVTAGRGMHGAPMRETAVFLMLSLARDARRLARQQIDHVWERRPPWSLLARKTAVIVGIGISGMAIGQLLKAFGMRVIGVSRTPREVEGFEAVVAFDRLAETAREADYLIDVLPGSPQNHGAIGGTVFAAMKPSAFFVNVGRGESVDEGALIAALEEKRIAGAGLDVFRTEPLPPSSPLWDMPNVVVMPHIGGFFDEYHDYAMPLVIENMRLFLAGRPGDMLNLVAH